MDYSLSRDKRDGEETDFLLFQIKMEKVDIIDIKKPENNSICIIDKDTLNIRINIKKQLKDRNKFVEKTNIKKI